MKNQVKFLLLFLMTSFLSVQNIAAQNVEQVSPIKAKLMARNGGLMVDVRENNEVAALAYDVENLVHIPLSEFEARLSELPKDKRLIMACRSGGRSQRAANILVAKGFTNVVNMQGGMIAWQGKKLGVKTGGKSSTKKACCANPTSKKCNPDGSCKSKKTTKKACAGSTGGKSCCKKK